MTPISRTEALDCLRSLAAGPGLVVHEVYDGDHWPNDKPLPRVYGTPEGFPASYLVAYATGRDASVLRSSEVLAVSKAAGEMHHLGAAGDEG